MVRRISPHFFSALVFLLAILGIVAIWQPTASAASAANFNPGRIIDDGVFFTPSFMSTDQVQNFLNAKVPTCDTNGTQNSSRWNSAAGRYYTRAEWGSLNGNPAPFTCLKDFRQDIPSRAADAYCSGSVTGGNKSAAQIITDVANACSINPQVLLVLLQKEQSLVTDDWPWVDQYTAATGFACPDTANCDPEFAGFFNQVYYGARQYQRYAKQSQTYNYRAYTSPYVLYNPNANCGGTNVYINNQATAGLYNYTPYQPNQAALNNLYGTGDSCSAYGNRNFWRLFTDWFGSTTLYNAYISLSRNLTASATTGYTGDTLNGFYEVSNLADYDIYVGGLGICARINGKNYDFGFADHTTIPAHGKITIAYNKKLTEAGTLNLFICSYNEALGGWASDRYPYNSPDASIRSVSVTVQDNPLITSGISMTSANPAIGQPVTATLTLRNNSPNPVNIGSMTVAGRDPAGRNVDFQIEDDVTIPGNGGVYTYSKTRAFWAPGNYSFFIANWNGIWTTTYPKSAAGSVVRQTGIQVRDNPLITSGVTLTPSNPTAGQPVTATMTLWNYGTTAINIGSLVIAARDASGKNVDFPIVNDVIVPAGGTYTYSQTRSFASSGTYKLYVANWNKVWTTSYPLAADDTVARQINVTIP